MVHVKQIEMVVSGHYMAVHGHPMGSEINGHTIRGDGAYVQRLPVDLDQLSPVARKLAEMIMTTRNDDDFSNIHVQGPSPAKQWKQDEVERLRQYIGGAMGDEYVNKPQIITWRWDCVHKNETPEQFFERHARQILEIGGKLIKVGQTE